jgi:hypothetical protein
MAASVTCITGSELYPLLASPLFSSRSRFVLEQDTNAYAVLPGSQWRGYRPPQPALGTLGWPCARGAARHILAALEGDPKAKLRVLEANAMTGLERALATGRES